MKTKFFEQAPLRHQNKYNYSQVNYVDHKTKVIIICTQHGEFSQTPHAHLKGQGCPVCGRLKTRQAKKLTTAHFITRAQQKHGNKYSYLKSNYQGQDQLIEIICATHGSFFQRAADHWSGHGCNQCAMQQRYQQLSLTTEQFINKCKIIHGDKYNYHLVNYLKQDEMVEIVCPYHGNFWQRAVYHLQGCDCPKCALNGISEGETIWLNGLDIKERQVTLVIDNKKIKVDGYDRDNNTIYEYYGNYWHGNPQVFEPEDMNKSVGLTFGELYQKTLDRERLIKKAGFNLIIKWETDI